MGRLILHAGMHKTGSSSIQQPLEQSGDVLLDREIAAATLQDSGSRATVLPQYRSRLESLVEAYGADRVHVRSYDSARPRLLADFGEWVFGQQVSLKTVRVNESLGNGPAHLLHALNCLAAEEPNQEKRERLQSEAHAFVRRLPTGARFVPPAFLIGNTFKSW